MNILSQVSESRLSDLKKEITQLEEELEQTRSAVLVTSILLELENFVRSLYISYIYRDDASRVFHLSFLQLGLTAIRSD